MSIFREKNTRLSRCALLFVLLALTAGCSSSATVSGKVSYKGEPLQSGIVLFVADNGWTGSSSINPDGTYSIPKAPPGQVKIAVDTLQPAQGADRPGMMGSGPMKGPPPGMTMVPPKDANVPKEVFEKSPLYNAPKLKIVPIPDKYKKVETSGLTYEVKRGKQEHNIDLP